MHKIAKFEKVSWKQFQSDWINTFGNGKTIHIDDVKQIYKNINLPSRKTRLSAGHDISIPFEFSINPGEKIMLPTGIRCSMDNNYVMLIMPRSSLGIKKGLRLSNTVAVIDADYYYANNEGHIFLSVENHGSETIQSNAGNNICQALFIPYGVADELTVTSERVGGIGSTG